MVQKGEVIQAQQSHARGKEKGKRRICGCRSGVSRDVVHGEYTQKKGKRNGKSTQQVHKMRWRSQGVRGIEETGVWRADKWK